VLVLRNENPTPRFIPVGKCFVAGLSPANMYIPLYKQTTFVIMFRKRRDFTEESEFHGEVKSSLYRLLSIVKCFAVSRIDSEHVPRLRLICRSDRTTARRARDSIDRLQGPNSIAGLVKSS